MHNYTHHSVADSTSVCKRVIVLPIGLLLKGFKEVKEMGSFAAFAIVAAGVLATAASDAARTHPNPAITSAGKIDRRAAFPMTMDLSTGAKVGNEVANDVIQEGNSILVTFRLNYEPVRFFPLSPYITCHCGKYLR